MRLAWKRALAPSFVMVIGSGEPVFGLVSNDQTHNSKLPADTSANIPKYGMIPQSAVGVPNKISLGFVRILGDVPVFNTKGILEYPVPDTLTSPDGLPA